jgi:hypothetical protein
MAANNLDFYNMCLEGIGKIKITDGQENNIYAAYYRSSFSGDYAESFSYDFGVNTKTIELSLKSYNSTTGFSASASSITFPLKYALVLSSLSTSLIMFACIFFLTKP